MTETQNRLESAMYVPVTNGVQALLSTLSTAQQVEHMTNMHRLRQDLMVSAQTIWDPRANSAVRNMEEAAAENCWEYALARAISDPGSYVRETRLSSSDERTRALDDLANDLMTDYKLCFGGKEQVAQLGDIYQNPFKRVKELHHQLLLDAHVLWGGIAGGKLAARKLEKAAIEQGWPAVLADVAQWSDSYGGGISDSGEATAIVKRLRMSLIHHYMQIFFNLGGGAAQTH